MRYASASVVLALGAGYVATGKFGLAALAAVALTLTVGLLAGTHWLALLCGVPAFYFPAPALSDRWAGPSPLLVAGVSTTVLVVAFALFRPNRAPLGAALVPASLLALFGVVQGDVSATLRSEFGLACIWFAASYLGAALAKDRRALERFVWILVPSGILTILECVGTPNFWNEMLGATRYSHWPTFAGLHRGMGTLGHPLPASAAFASFAALSYGLGGRSRSFTMLSVLYALSAVATLSRTALVVLVIMFLCSLLIAPNDVTRRRLIVNGSLMVVIVAIALLTTPITESFSERGASSDNSGREASVKILAEALTSDPGGLIFGEGFRGASGYLRTHGGNVATGLEFSDVFDNQLITSVYDFGMLPMAMLLSFMIFAVRHSSRDDRFIFLPPLVGTVTACVFFDGLYWPVSGFLLFLFTGALSQGTAVARSWTEVPGLRRSRVERLPVR